MCTVVSLIKKLLLMHITNSNSSKIIRLMEDFMSILTQHLLIPTTMLLKKLGLSPPPSFCEMSPTRFAFQMWRGIFCKFPVKVGTVKKQIK